MDAAFFRILPGRPSLRSRHPQPARRPSGYRHVGARASPRYCSAQIRSVVAFSFAAVLQSAWGGHKLGSAMTQSASDFVLRPPWQSRLLRSHSDPRLTHRCRKAIRRGPRVGAYPSHISRQACSRAWSKSELRLCAKGGGNSRQDGSRIRLRNPARRWTFSQAGEAA